MGFLDKTRVYLIGGMQYENGEPWRDLAAKSLSPRGVVVFNPYTKPFITENPEDNAAREQLQIWMKTGQYDLVAERMKSVRADDLRLCDISDFFIVSVNPEIPSWGSAEELTTITRMKKPTFIFVKGGKTKTPLWILGMIPHKYIYDSLEDVLKVLTAIDDGTKELDNVRWRLLRKEFR